MKKTTATSAKPKVLALNRETLIYCLGGERRDTGTPNPGPTTADAGDPGQTSYTGTC